MIFRGVVSLFATYENRSDGISVEWKKTVHVPPHLHEAMEMVYVTKGNIELGVGQELYHMDEGDFAIVFPNVIHHYQVFDANDNKVVYLYPEPSMFPNYCVELEKYSPKNPVIKKKNLHHDIICVIKAIISNRENTKDIMLIKAYIQVILAHIFSEMEMVEKSMIGSNDLIYNSVEYVAKNFKNELNLEKMAYDLCVNKYALSRMFAKTFHCNFNKYVNGIRLSHAASLLENSGETITNIWLDCGFESQRTFNRVFKERYKMTPREYRSKCNSDVTVG